MSKVISVANQKGGVGKTTSSVSIASELAHRGRRVLLIDMDPQASGTSGLGVELLAEGEDLYDVFFGKKALSEVVRVSPFENLSVVPASKDLVSLELEIGKQPGRELILKSELKLLLSKYDYVVIDCPPSSGLLTLNALGASDHVIVPLQAEYYALEGITSLMTTIEFVKSTFNPALSILGVFLTMFDARTNLSNQVESEAREFFGKSMFATKIPRNIKLSESPSHGLPIGRYDPFSIGAKAYASLTQEIITRVEGAKVVKVANS